MFTIFLFLLVNNRMFYFVYIFNFYHVVFYHDILISYSLLNVFYLFLCITSMKYKCFLLVSLKTRNIYTKHIANLYKTKSKEKYILIYTLIVAHVKYNSWNPLFAW